jgi:hypothetical protein
MEQREASSRWPQERGVTSSFVVRRVSFLLLAATGCGGVVGAQPSKPDAAAAEAGGGSSGSSSSGGSGVANDASVTSDAAAPDVDSCAPGHLQCGSTCVDPQTDDANCGGCGLACPTGCSAGRCVVTLASTTGGCGVAIAVDATSVYWTDACAGAVMKVPLAGGAVTTLASSPGASSLAIDATNVYFSDGYEGDDAGVRSVPLQGGPVTALSTGIAGVGGLVVDAARIYWVQGNAVVSMPLGGGGPTTLATGTFGIGDGTPQALVGGAGRLLWDNDGSLMGTSTHGGATSSRAIDVPPAGYLGPLASDAQNVYTATVAAYDDGASHIAVVQIPLGGAAPIVLEFPRVLPCTVAVDATDVYYAGLAPASGTCESGSCFVAAIRKVPVGGGKALTVADVTVPPKMYWYAAIAVDATSAYFTWGPAVYKVTPK